MANSIAELVFIPAPGVGHLVPIIEFAKVLAARDLHLSITVLVIHPPPEFGGSAVTAYIESLSADNTTDQISFIELPPENAPPISKAFMLAMSDIISRHYKSVREIVADKMKVSQSGRVVGFVIDMFCTGMIDVANEFNLPTYVFISSNASFLGFKFHIQTLCDDVDLKLDVIELSNSDSLVDVPSFVNPVPTKVFPAEVRTREDLDVVVESARKMREAKGIIVNSFLELDTHAIKSLSENKTIPPVYPVGPLLKLEGDGGIGLSDNEIMTWLDTQPPSSVVLFCFGSLGSFNETQVKKIARGLEKSGHRFVWSLRDYEDPRKVLPEGFLERTAGIGKVVGWVPQVALLAHSAVGGFVSHCGWNSMLESLWFGVPTATWPIYAEQQINAFKMVVEHGLAVEITLDYTKGVFNQKVDEVIVTSKEIESGIRRVMEDNEVKKKVKEMSEKSRAAVANSGTAYVSIGHLVHDFKSNIS